MATNLVCNMADLVRRRLDPVTAILYCAMAANAKNSEEGSGSGYIRPD